MADTATDSAGYSGTVSGFGGSNGADTTEFIELGSVPYSSGVVSANYEPNGAHPTSGGVLIVTSSGATVAEIDLAGRYVTSNFDLTSGAGGSGTIITDPPAPQGGNAHSANIALLGNYIASFAAGGLGGFVVSHGSDIEPLPLGPPYA